MKAQDPTIALPPYSLTAYTIGKLMSRSLPVRALLGLRRLMFAKQLRARGVILAQPVDFPHLAPRVHNGGSMQIGIGLVVRAPVTRAQIESIPGGRLVIGDNVFINEGVIIAAARGVTIGNDTKIGDFATIHDSDFHAITPDRPVRIAAVTIGRNVWVGRNVVVLPGVSIGENSVVAAGTIVTSDVAPNTLVAGNPARVIRELDIQNPSEFVRA
jgi:acetyltransferase-like isoleucine patch superfamily enzyme